MERSGADHKKHSRSGDSFQRHAVIPRGKKTTTRDRNKGVVEILLMHSEVQKQRIGPLDYSRISM